MNQLTDSNSWGAGWREMKIALLNGGTIAPIAGVATALWFANPAPGGVIAAAMVVNIFVAGVAGVAIPLFLDRLDQDPAGASSIFVTLTTASMGFLAFLGSPVARGITSLSQQSSGNKS